MSRIEQINKILSREISNLISKQGIIDNCLITINNIDCSPDLKNAKIYISVLPYKYSNRALEKIKKYSVFFTKNLQKKIRLRRIPKFNWIISKNEEKAALIEKILKNHY